MEHCEKDRKQACMLCFEEIEQDFKAKATKSAHYWICKAFCEQRWGTRESVLKIYKQGLNCQAHPTIFINHAIHEYKCSLPAEDRIAEGEMFEEEVKLIKFADASDVESIHSDYVDTQEGNTDQDYVTTPPLTLFNKSIFGNSVMDYSSSEEEYYSPNSADDDSYHERFKQCPRKINFKPTISEEPSKKAVKRKNSASSSKDEPKIYKQGLNHTITSSTTTTTNSELSSSTRTQQQLEQSATVVTKKVVSSQRN